MSINNPALANKLAERTGKMTPIAYEHVLKNWLVSDKKRNLKKVNALMGNDQMGQRLLIACVTCLQQNPALLECTTESFFLSIMRCAELRLFPGPMGECAIVPFKEHGVMKAQFMPMYFGLAKLCYQGGFVKQITPGVVLEGDDFSYQKGSGGFLRHRPTLESRDNRERVAYYNYILTVDGGEVFEVLHPDDIAKFKARSRGANSDYSPWNSKHQEDRDWMALKTVFKQNQKMIPRSPELARAVAFDNAAESADAEQSKDLFDLASVVEAEYSAADTMQNKPQEEAKQLPPQTGVAAPQQSVLTAATERVAVRNKVDVNI